MEPREATSDELSSDQRSGPNVTIQAALSMADSTQAASVAYTRMRCCRTSSVMPLVLSIVAMFQCVDDVGRANMFVVVLVECGCAQCLFGGIKLGDNNADSLVLFFFSFLAERRIGGRMKRSLVQTD